MNNYLSLCKTIDLLIKNPDEYINQLNKLNYSLRDSALLTRFVNPKYVEQLKSHNKLSDKLDDLLIIPYRESFLSNEIVDELKNLNLINEIIEYISRTDLYVYITVIKHYTIYREYNIIYKIIDYIILNKNWNIINYFIKNKHINVKIKSNINYNIEINISEMFFKFLTPYLLLLPDDLLIQIINYYMFNNFSLDYQLSYYYSYKIYNTKYIPFELFPITTDKLLYTILILFTDEYIIINNLKIFKFISIINKLPLDLQLLICNQYKYNINDLILCIQYLFNSF